MSAGVVVEERFINGAFNTLKRDNIVYCILWAYLTSFGREVEIMGMQAQYALYIIVKSILMLANALFLIITINSPARALNTVPKGLVPVGMPVAWDTKVAIRFGFIGRAKNASHN